MIKREREGEGEREKERGRDRGEIGERGRLTIINIGYIILLTN